MKQFFKLGLAACIVLIFSATSALAANSYPTLNKDNTLYINVKSGIIKIQLLPDVAPLHVERIKTLAKEGFYDGIIFHRVIDGFMAQTGDPTGTGRGGSEMDNVKAEFTTKYSFERGVIGMARSGHPDSANSQFFIMLDDGAFLDNNYTIWGHVVDGMNSVDALAKGEPPANPDQMLKVYSEE
ncbi:MAG: peptidylprolyl isomerase [Alphaproteobacteria bacterium]|nr:peptidylprolyl isomerase [Alphaproteobacteria bacterium]